MNVSYFILIMMIQIFIYSFFLIFSGQGDGGIDIDGKIISIPFVVQCKYYEYRKIGPETVRQLEEVLSYKSWDTIGILVIPNRNDFTRGVIEAVNNSLYNILLTDRDNIIIDLLEYTINILENGQEELKNNIYLLEDKIEKNRLELELKNRLEKLETNIDKQFSYLFFYLFLIFFILFFIFFIFFLYIVYIFIFKIKNINIEFY